MIYAWIVSACWVAFIVYWIISAATSKRNLSSRFGWAGIVWRVAFMVTVIVLVRLQIVTPALMTSIALAQNPFWAPFGAALCVLGVALAVWARVHLGRNWGMPMSIKENPELVVSGPYVWIRNPIYTGMLVAMLGTALAISLLWLAVFVISAVYFIYSAKKEEGIMLKEFPNDYPAYKARTKMLVPFIF